MRFKRLLAFSLSSLILFASCEKENAGDGPMPEKSGDYTTGVFILNEGNFGSGNSSVSFMNEEMQSVSHHIFTTENEVESLGDTGQDIGFYGDHTFIVLNVSNKVEVVDRYSFEKIGSIDSGLLNPRYISFANEKAYITNWGDGSNPDDDYVSVIDTESLDIIKNISVEEGPEELVTAQGKLYVAHPGGFSINNKLSVIDPAVDEVKKVLQVGDAPNSLEANEAYLWVASGGKPAYTGEETAGKILKIDLAKDEIEQELGFARESQHPSNLELDDTRLYYTIGTEVFSFDQNEMSLPDNAVSNLEEVGILYGFEVRNGFIFAASANTDFTGDGDLFIYDSEDGALLNSFKTGINPNGIYFND